MNANKTRILSIVDDEVLATTRQMVLESAGFQVRSSSSLRTIEELEAQQFDLALLCHSVQEAKVSAIARFLRETHPAISILQLCTAFKSRANDVLRIDPRGPEELLLEIDAVLSKKSNFRSSEIRAILRISADRNTFAQQSDWKISGK